MKRSELREMIRQQLHEIELTKQQEQAIDELALIQKEINEYKAKIKELSKKEKAFEVVMAPVIDVLETLDDGVIQTSKTAMKLKQSSYSRETVSYKDGYLAGLTKVNAKTRSMLEDIMKSNTKIHTVATQYSLIIKEESTMKKISKYINGIYKSLKGKLSAWTTANDELEKIAKKIKL